MPKAIETTESRLIGALMLDHAEMVNVVDIITPDSFSEPKMGLVFLVMYRMFQDGKPWDSVVLASALEADGKLGYVGGIEALEACISFAGSSKIARPYAEMVAADCKRRQVAKAGREMAESVEQGADPAEMADIVHDRLLAIVGESSAGGLAPYASGPSEVLTVAQAARKGDRGRLVETGLVALDVPLGGLRGGQLIVLAARPGMGKTALAMCVARNAATCGKVVAFWSLEMSKIELAQRVVAIESGLDLREIISGKLRQDADWSKLADACSKCAGYMGRMLIDDRGSLTPAALRAGMRRAMHTVKPDLVVVDYIQLMTAPGAGDNRQLEVANISRNLKLLAKDFDVPVLALSQLSRAVEHRQSPIPVLSDLRESGAIEQDADVVLFIHRDDDGGITLRVAKQRNGPIGDRTDIEFVKHCATFRDGAGGDRFFA